jgi:hypothetical protein
MTMKHPLRTAAFLSLLAYVGAAAALLWRRPTAA